MKEKSISFCQGKGSLTHNNRDFIADNVHRDRLKDNITFIKQPIGEAYEYLFSESTERYNASQKRNDRKIKTSYFESVFNRKPSGNVLTAADKRKSFYEDVVQIGKMEDSGFTTEDPELVAECLKEYMAGYQQRNPNFYVFNAVLHMDEATPHLHIDYIPFGHYKRGQDIQNGIAQALKEMGYGTGKDSIARWRASEVEVLNKICLEHGIKPKEPEKSRGTLSVKEYKEVMRETERLAAENQMLKDENRSLSDQLTETQNELEKANKKKVKLMDIENIEAKPTVFGNKVTVPKDDYDHMRDLAVKEIVSIKQTRTLRAENENLSTENELLKKKVTEQEKELSEYRKPTYFSRDTLRTMSRDISEKEQLKAQLQKAFAFIQSLGLMEKFKNFHMNTRRNELE